MASRALWLAIHNAATNVRIPVAAAERLPEVVEVRGWFSA